jgi:homospermidine synthase
MPAEDGRPVMMIVGVGAVCQVFLPIMMAELDWPWDHIVFLDAAETVKTRIPAPLLEKARFVVHELGEENHRDIFAKYLGAGDVLLNLSVIHSLKCLLWCMENDVSYMDTSREEWASDERVHRSDRLNRSLLSMYDLNYANQVAFEKFHKEHPGRRVATSVLCHGMNPGMVSHFAKIGLRDIANKLMADKPDDSRVPDIRAALEAKNFARVSQLLGVKVIHISERDSQASVYPKAVNEFVNTWSIPGFIEETGMYSQVGWGTHERFTPTDAMFFDYGEKNIACLATKGGKTKARSWVPSGPIMGYVMPHDECFSMSKYLTIRDETTGEPVYRPSVYFVYQPSDLAIASLHEFEARGYVLQDRIRVLNDREIAFGKDEVGVLIMGHDYGAWWVGTRLDIASARELVPGHNATTLQVACSVLGGLKWLLANPWQGVHYPETLPSEEILAIARKYLEPVVSVQSSWNPLNDRTVLSLFDHNETFGECRAEEDAPCYPTERHQWMFPLFLTQPMTLTERK